MNKIQHIFSLLLISVAFSLISGASIAQNQTLTFPNTNVKMDVPQGYEASTENGFSGLVNMKEGNQFVITAIPGAYDEVKKQLTPEAIAATGVLITDSAPYVTNGMSGTLYTGTQTEGELTMNKYILLFGNSSNTYMIMAVYKPSTSGKEILGCLETIKI